MAKVLVIGYGNTLRGDDGLGPCAAEQLASDFADRPEVDVRELQVLTPELAEPVSRAKFVLFVDASVEGTPGALDERGLQAPAARESAFTHHFDPPDLLALAGILYGSLPDAVVLSVTGKSFECSEGLTPTVARCLPRLLERARTLVRVALQHKSATA